MSNVVQIMHIKRLKTVKRQEKCLSYFFFPFPTMFSKALSSRSFKCNGLVLSPGCLVQVTITVFCRLILEQHLRTSLSCRKLSLSPPPPPSTTPKKYLSVGQISCTCILHIRLKVLSKSFSPFPSKPLFLSCLQH